VCKPKSWCRRQHDRSDAEEDTDFLVGLGRAQQNTIEEIVEDVPSIDSREV
jgi:hypothetical protein